MKLLTFTKKILKSPLATGAIAPSSRALGEALMTVDAHQYKVKNLVEVGSGTGAITRVISEFIPEQTKVTLMELDPEFCEELKKMFPDYAVIEGDAALIGTHIKDPIDFLVCSIPWTLIPRKKRHELLKAFKQALHPEHGVMVTFVYAHMMALPTYGELMEDFGQYFKLTKEKIVFGNLPPAQVISLRLV